MNLRRSRSMGSIKKLFKVFMLLERSILPSLAFRNYQKSFYLISMLTACPISESCPPAQALP